ncbi:MAG: polyprenyl synthetase family protein [Phycisphaerales bacterium]
MTRTGPTSDPLACLGEIEHALERFIDGLPLPDSLVAAIRYAALGGGKRLRPALAWHACAAAGGDPARSLPAGVAIELIHAFSLVHDDLPAMDDDDLRRGKPTLHIHAGESMAILAGDAMLALAFQHLAHGEDDPALSAALVGELATATGGMIAGQVYDTLGGLPTGLSDLDRVRLVHRNKTGALIRAAVRMGGMSGSASIAQLATLTRFGEAVGLMFQIVDDLLDVETSTEQAGKRTRKDAASGKLTYPGFLGIDGARQEVATLQRDARAALIPLGDAAVGLASLATTLALRQS